mgnify:CR=1 FL=1
MRISRSEEYGVRLILGLASAGDQLTIREMSSREGLPEPTVAKVVARLRRAGLVRAERGRNGGYSLGRPADGISLAAVLNALDEAMYDESFCERVSPDGSCSRGPDCQLRPVWRGLTALVGKYLERITVADLVGGRPAPDAGSLLPVMNDRP